MLSMITLVRDRNELLRSFLRGVAWQEGPVEVVVVHAGGDEDPREVVSDVDGLRATVCEVAGADERIPYSAARNAGAEAASGEHLAFCDADTIASPTFAGAIGRALSRHDALCTGEVRYLPPGEADAGFDTLLARSRPHPHREAVPAAGVALGGRHELVWGLCMAMRHSTFDAVGGFDEGYGGYAGEDTDLGQALRAAGVPVALVADAVVLHQHHDSYEPPVQQLRATVANAQRYRDKWGAWPMAGWLEGFAEMGLVAWTPTSTRCEVLRDPSPAELDRCRRVVALPFEEVTV